MEPVIEFLIKNPSLITAGATVVLCFATATLCYFTFLLYGVTKKMVEISSQPFIVATFEPNQWTTLKYCDLVISNTGNASAFDIKIKMVPETRTDIASGEQSAKPIPMNNISVLPPGKEMRSSFSKTSDIMGEENLRSFVITWKMSPEQKEPYLLTYDYFFPPEIGLFGGGSPEVKIANELKKLREHLVRKDSSGNQ